MVVLSLSLSLSLSLFVCVCVVVVVVLGEQVLNCVIRHMVSNLDFLADCFSGLGRWGAQKGRFN